MLKIEETVDALLGRFTNDVLRDATKAQVREFLLSVCDGNSMIPAVVPIYSGDAAVLYWMVGESSVEVEIDCSGAVYFSSIDQSSKVESISEPASSIAYSTARYIGDMKRRVVLCPDPLG